MGQVIVERLALGGVAPKPWRVEAAEGGVADVDAMADLLLAGARPTPDNAYKLPLVRRTIAAALAQVAREAAR